MGRRCAAQERHTDRAFRGSGGRRRTGLFEAVQLGCATGTSQRSLALAAGRHDASPERRRAVFYIHPTTYLDRDRWNAPLDAGGETQFRTRLFVQSQASAFTAAGQVWAPRYRQAAFGAFLLESEDAQKALDLAYRDVSAAFDEFVRESGDRPIILAGHSQGALQLERLLKEKVAGKPIARRIVAAYVVGWPISATADLPALGLPPCSKDVQTGCILSWLTFGDPPTRISSSTRTNIRPDFRDRTQARGPVVREPH